MTSPLHPYDPATVTAAHGRASDDHPRHYRAAVVVTYHGPATRGATWRATLRRSPSDRPVGASVPAHDGPDAAVAALLTKLGLDWRMLPAAGSPDGGGRYVYVAELTPGEGRALAGGERAVLAMLAARELEALTLGDATASVDNPYGVAVALSRMATGTDRVRPLISGWAMGLGGSTATAATDHLGRPVVTLRGDLSPAHALAACAAAGWMLTTDARHVAAKHMADPDPAAVAVALQALGGCPAVIATVQGVAA
jgi:hypothetical protein